MEKEQLELLKKENLELKQQMGILEKEILLQKNKISVNKTEVYKLIDDDYSNTTSVIFLFQTTLFDVDSNSLKLSVSSNNDRLDFEETIEISYKEIGDWLEEQNKPLTKDNLYDCVKELCNTEIDNHFY
jgi:hypothetical protein